MGGGSTDAGSFTGAFPASVLVNAPRTGMMLASASLALGPAAQCSDQDILTTCFRNGSPRLAALVLLNGTPITQADVASIYYTIFLLTNNPDSSKVIKEGVSLDPTTVIFDTVQSDAQASGFNFLHQVPATTDPVEETPGTPGFSASTDPVFVIAGRNYGVEYRIQPVTGQVVIIRFVVSVL